ncbi:MAG: S9 family peptidase [Opitutales bacterium]|nr:S9 family peptidase [Opitutales bacterium]
MKVKPVSGSVRSGRVLTAVLCLGLVWLWCGAAAAGGRVLGYHVEDFFRPVALSSPQLSPDGEHVAYVTTRRRRATVVVRGIESERERVLHSSGADTGMITELRWLTNERVAYQENFGTLTAINIDLSKRTELYDAGRVLLGWGFLLFGDFAYPRILSRLPQDPDYILVHARGRDGLPRVSRVEIHTGEAEVVQDGQRDVYSWIADRSGTVRIGMQYQRGQERLLYREAPGARWRSLDRVMPDDDGRFAYSGRTLAGRRHHFLGFARDADVFYLASNAGRDRAALFSYRLSTGERTLLAEDPVYDLFTYGGDHLAPVFSARTGDLAGIYYDAEQPHALWFDPAFEALQAAVDRRLPETINFITGMDAAENRFVVYSASSRHKGLAHLYDRGSGELTALAEADRRFRAEDMSAMRPIEFPGRDGHALHGYLTVPKDRPKGVPNRTVVLIHGGPWIRDTYGYHPEVQFLAYHGFTVLQVNFRGSTGYGFAHLDALRGDLGDPAVRDILDGLDWAVGQGYADPDRVAAMGASYGGLATLRAMAVAPDRFRAGVAVAGVYDIPGQLRHTRRAAPRMGYEFWREMTGGIWNRRELREMSPLGSVDRVRAPVFVAHGVEDVVVPPEQSEQLVEALAAAGIVHEFLLLEDTGHGTGPMRDRILLYERILRFLNEHVKEADR